jgi:hypothetical protein
VAPEHVRQWRSRARLRKTLMGGRTAWQQRIRAVLYHHGVSGAPEHLRTLAGHEFLAKLKLPVDATERIDVALEMIDTLEIQLAAIESELRKLTRRPDRLQGAHAPLRDGRADLAGDAHRARRRLAPKRLAPGGALRRDRHRRAPTAKHGSGSSPAKAQQNFAGRCMRPRRPASAQTGTAGSPASGEEGASRGSRAETFFALVQRPAGTLPAAGASPGSASQSSASPGSDYGCGTSSRGFQRTSHRCPSRSRK